MDFLQHVLDLIWGNPIIPEVTKAKFGIGAQIYFIRYDIIHCGFINHIHFDIDQTTFIYETDLVDILAECDTEDFVNLTVAEDDAFATLDELMYHLKGNMIISRFI